MKTKAIFTAITSALTLSAVASSLPAVPIAAQTSGNAALVASVPGTVKPQSTGLSKWKNALAIAGVGTLIAGAGLYTWNKRRQARKKEAAQKAEEAAKVKEELKANAQSVNELESSDASLTSQADSDILTSDFSDAMPEADIVGRDIVEVPEFADPSTSAKIDAEPPLLDPSVEPFESDMVVEPVVEAPPVEAKKSIKRGINLKEAKKKRLAAKAQTTHDMLGRIDRLFEDHSAQDAWIWTGNIKPLSKSLKREAFVKFGNKQDPSPMSQRPDRISEIEQAYEGAGSLGEISAANHPAVNFEPPVDTTPSKKRSADNYGYDASLRPEDYIRSGFKRGDDDSNFWNISIDR